MDYNINNIGTIISVEGNKPVVEYNGQSVLVSTSTTITTPTVDRAVDGSYLAIMSQCSTSLVASSAPSGWTSITNFGTTNTVEIYYKILETSDSGARYTSTYGGTQYDQILFFRNTTGQSFRRVRVVGTTTSTTSGAISSTLSIESGLKMYGPTFIALHYYFNTVTSTPTITYNVPMTRVANSSSALAGMNYLIYNKTTPSQLTQTVTSTLSGTIRQAIFWLELY